jgi:predicted dehydrogenase
VTDDLRVGVIGGGVMGANHARVARQLRRASLAAVVDQDLTRARALAGASDALVTSSVGDALQHIDLAVIAVPTAAHLDVAMECIAAGVHVLVEKPIAASADAARSLVKAAADAGVVLAVGHVERFNAAVAELPKLLTEPLHIKAVRVSPYSPRIGDGVVHDLMIHDLDIVLSLAGPGASVVAVSGAGRALRSPNEDLAFATVTFDSGLTASLETSRLAQQKVRIVEVTEADSVVSADLLRQDVTIHRMSRHEYLADDGVRYRQSSVIEVPFLDQRGEPLLNELQDVVDSVLDGRPPRVTGDDGVRAVELADRVADALTRS